jgi:DnaJ family protein C protein 2
MDEPKRKAYDSSLPFDESFPTKNINEENFYTLFEAVFMRNAIFSKKKPVPHIGGPKTLLK